LQYYTFIRIRCKHSQNLDQQWSAVPAKETSNENEETEAPESHGLENRLGGGFPQTECVGGGASRKNVERAFVAIG